MKKYFSPSLEITAINAFDIITASFNVQEAHGGDVYSLDELVDMYKNK